MRIQVAPTYNTRINNTNDQTSCSTDQKFRSVPNHYCSLSCFAYASMRWKLRRQVIVRDIYTTSNCTLHVDVVPNSIDVLCPASYSWAIALTFDKTGELYEYRYQLHYYYDLLFPYYRMFR